MFLAGCLFPLDSNDLPYPYKIFKEADVSIINMPVLSHRDTSSVVINGQQ